MSDIDHGKTMSDTDQKLGISDEPVSVNINDVLPSDSDSLQTRILAAANHRRLNARQIQLTSIAGSIGAALFVAIGSGVLSGPLCLLIGESFLSIRIHRNDHIRYRQELKRGISFRLLGIGRLLHRTMS